MIQKKYLELENQIYEDTLFSSTFEVPKNKVPSES